MRVLENTIRLRSEVQRKKGLELDATCQICLKTKFADGVGHICNYCNIRCCARCGGKVSLRSNKVSVEVLLGGGVGGYFVFFIVDRLIEDGRN